MTTYRVTFSSTNTDGRGTDITLTALVEGPDPRAELSNLIDDLRQYGDPIVEDLNTTVAEVEPTQRNCDHRQFEHDGPLA